MSTYSKGEIIFNGVSSLDLGLVVQTFPSYVAPKRDYDVTHIPGRNGDIVIDKGSFQNVERTYTVAAGEYGGGGFIDLVTTMAEWLYTPSGYVELSDSYDPDHYRMALFTSALEVSNAYNDAAAASIKFNCKPQRYLVSGLTSSTKSNSSGSSQFALTVTNPTPFAAKPKIVITGSSWTTNPKLSIANTTAGTTTTYTIKAAGSDSSLSSRIVTIDSELQTYYTNSETDGLVTMTVTSGSYPTLESGTNTITVSTAGTVTKIEVIPRWWTI